MSKKELTSGELAAALGVSPGRVRQLAAARVLPRLASGRYSLTPCRKAYQDYKRAAADAGDESVYLQYLKTSNDLMELQNKIKRGDLIHRDDYIVEIGRLIAACRSRLLVLPSKAAPLIVGNDDKGARGILTRMVNEARRELETPIDFFQIAKAALTDKKR